MEQTNEQPHSIPNVPTRSNSVKTRPKSHPPQTDTPWCTSALLRVSKTTNDDYVWMSSYSFRLYLHSAPATVTIKHGIPSIRLYMSSDPKKGSPSCRGGMIPTVSPRHDHFRVATFAACDSFRLARGGGCRSSDGEHATGVARRYSDAAVGPNNAKRRAPTWMTSPIFPHASGKQQRQLSASARINASSVPAKKNALPTVKNHRLVPRRAEAGAAEVIAVVENRGLLVRGGAGVEAAGVLASAPLGALVVATGCLTRELERRTKLGAIVGSPLLSFATFCLLR